VAQWLLAVIYVPLVMEKALWMMGLFVNGANHCLKKLIQLL
jgi:hypothetical protein